MKTVTLYTLEHPSGYRFNNKFYTKRPSMSWVGGPGSGYVITKWSCTQTS